jgi:hypothetical protein
MTAARNTRLAGNAPPICDVVRSASVSSTPPPGEGRRMSARPKNTALVAIVATIGCKRPTTTSTPLRPPQASPATSTATTPASACGVSPITIVEARQLQRTRIMPADRSIPPVITTSACAAATKASSAALLAAVCTTFHEKPAGWFDR